MLQLGSLVVLCSLLTGTSASLSEIFQNLNVRVEFTQDPQLQDWRITVILLLTGNSRDSNRFNISLFTINMRIRLNDLRIQDLQAGLSSNDNGPVIKMSLVVDASVHMPNNNSRDNTTIVLDLQCSLRVVTESQNSRPYVTLWKCSIETMKDISDSSGRLVSNDFI